MDASNITTDSSTDFKQLLNKFNKLELNIQAENEKLAKTVKQHEKKLNQLNNEKGTERRKYQDDLKEHQKKIDRLEEENKEQNARIDGLEKGVNRLKAQKIKLQEQVTETGQNSPDEQLDLAVKIVSTKLSHYDRRLLPDVC
ncbi:hypothetical protein F4604DRAFT_1673179 [Suillus subluteus]|nr:hypothetical protein F4604DRAFT_1673179 [Suillus subluteus]